MVGHYIPGRDPRMHQQQQQQQPLKHESEDKRDRAEELSRKRPRTENNTAAPEAQTKSLNMPLNTSANVERDPSVASDETQFLHDRIGQLNAHIVSMHANNAKITSEKATIAREKADVHKRLTTITTQHADVVKSHAKRIAEKDKLIEENATLLQDNADLRIENAAHIDDLVEKERMIKELENEKDELMSARQADVLKLENLQKERAGLQKRVNALLDDIRREKADAERDRDKGRDRGRSRAPEGDRDRDRGRSKARSRYRGTERERKDDGVEYIGGGESYRPPPGRELSRPPRTWTSFPSGKQPPSEPKGGRKSYG